MYIFKGFISIVVMMSVVVIFLTSHIEDGNVWGIYMENGHLLIGDFWSAVAVVVLLFGVYTQAKAIIKYIHKLSKEQ